MPAIPRRARAEQRAAGPGVSSSAPKFDKRPFAPARAKRSRRLCRRPNADLVLLRAPGTAAHALAAKCNRRTSEQMTLASAPGWAIGVARDARRARTGLSAPIATPMCLDLALRVTRQTEWSMGTPPVGCEPAS
jgi:hypothetical protein